MEPGAKGRGQVLVGVIILLMLIAILVPAMVLYVQNEARWSVKQQENLLAFQLAEGAVDRGLRKISESTTTWANGQAAVFPAGYQFNQTYADLSGGCYAISISSGPAEEQVTIITVGMHLKQKEVRAIKAIYNNSVTDIAVHAKGAVAITGNNFQLEWGSVVTPKSITIGSRLHPQYYSGGSIDLDVNGSSPPNCDSPDCLFWFSYDTDIPPQPDMDFDFYRSSAQGGATFPGATLGTYWAGDATFGNIEDTTGRTFFVEGNAHISSSGGRHYIVGNLIVMGNLTTSNGNIGTGTETIPVPQTAWKQYGKDWAFYRATYDAAAPAAFPGPGSSYRSSAALTYTIISKVFTHGFLYIGGNFNTGNGGGSFALVGTAYVNGGVTLATNSQGRLYYNADVANKVKNTNIILTRESWQDLPAQKWPAGLTCAQ